MKTLARWMLLSLFTAIAADAFAQSGASNKALLAAARKAEPGVIQSLQDMVQIESGSDDRAGVQSMADYVERRLQALGAGTERIPATTGSGDLVKGTLEGKGRLRAMLIAHMDTVYETGILQSEPFRREGNKLYGPGIADDKGGIAVILHALQLLQAAGWRDYARITVVFNPDEEVGSPGSGDTLAQLGSQHDIVLSFEPSPSKEVAQAEGVLLAAAGTAQARLVVEGRAAHAGSAPDQGRNALLELAHQIEQTSGVAEQVPDVQMNWTTAQAGLKRNQIPALAQAGADVRLLNLEAGDRLLAVLQARVAESQRIPDTRTTVTLEPGRPPYVAGRRGEILAARAQSIYAELDGRKLLLLPVTFGGTDAGFAGVSGQPAVLESLGLAGWGYHARDEYIEVDSIVPRLYLAARMLVELGRRPDMAK